MSVLNVMLMELIMITAITIINPEGSLRNRQSAIDKFG